MNSAFAGPIGLIVNLHSQRNYERLEKLRATYRAADRLLAREIADVKEIPAILGEFARAGVTVVVVSGGDGTVQATMTSLAADPKFPDHTPLAVLAGGMTNVTGHHVGIPGKPDIGLAALLARRAQSGALALHRHPVMSVRASPEAAPHYGMLLGGAAFHDGTMMARKRVHPVGFAQSAAAGIAGAVLCLRAVLGRAGHGHRMALAVDGNGGPAGRCYILLVSCLPGLILGLDPFWGEGTAPLRWTWVDHPPRRIGIAAGPLLLGKPMGWMVRDGYRSGRAMRLEVESETPLLFDGERIEPQPGKPVIIESGTELTFARL
jgi:hypothetical protein